MDYKVLAEKLAHVAVTHITPFDQDQEVDHVALRRHVRFLVESGVRVIVTNGNTAEFYSLTVDECKSALEATVAEVGSEAIVIAGVGHDCRTAIELTRHAEATGAHAVMVHNPVNPYQVGEGLIAYYDRIAESTELGVLPYVRNPAVDLEVLSRVARHANVVGCKYGINDLQRFAEIVTELPHDKVGVAWICGTAETWAPFFFKAGAVGFTSGLANVAPDKALGMFDALTRGDDRATMALWRLLRPFEEMRARKASGLNVSVVKEAMELAGVRTGGVRPPIAPLTEHERAELKGILIDWGILV